MCVRLSLSLSLCVCVCVCVFARLSLSLSLCVCVHAWAALSSTNADITASVPSNCRSGKRGGGAVESRGDCKVTLRARVRL